MNYLAAVLTAVCGCFLFVYLFFGVNNFSHLHFCKGVLMISLMFRAYFVSFHSDFAVQFFFFSFLFLVLVLLGCCRLSSGLTGFFLPSHKKISSFFNYFFKIIFSFFDSFIVHFSVPNNFGTLVVVCLLICFICFVLFFVVFFFNSFRFKSSSFL